MNVDLFSARIEIRKEIAQFLLTARQAAGLSVVDAAQKSETLSADEISAYETGGQPVSTDHLFELARIFGVPDAQLYGLLARISRIDT